VLAYFIDAIVMNIGLGIVSGIIGIGMAPMSALGADESVVFSAAFATTMSVSFIGNWLYFAIMESCPLQATVGKLAIGLIVTDVNGARIGFLRATGRYFGKILSGLILFIGFIMVAFTERKQGLHDLMAGTLVYKTRDPRMVVEESGVFA